MRFKKSIILVFLLCISAIFVGVLVRSEALITNKKTSKDKVQVKEETESKGNINLEANLEDIKEESFNKLNILAVGDIMFHSPQFKAAYDWNTGVYDFAPVFKYVKKHIQSSDIAIGNLETVIAGDGLEYSGYPRFNTPKEAVLGINQAGFDILVTANNHTLDQGKKGLINTIETIAEYKMKNLGSYIEKESGMLIEERNEIKIGFLSYTYGLNGMDSTLSSEELSYMVNKIDEDKIKKDLEKSKEANLDLTLIYIHWGREYQGEPSEYQIELAEKMLAWGADIILGSHPHVIQKSQKINIDGEDKFVVYSMGNFLSNQRLSSMGNSFAEDGIMIDLEIEKSSLTGLTKISKVEYIPTWVYRHRENGKLVYEILPVQEVLEEKIDVVVDEDIRRRLKKSFEGTMSKMVNW